MKKNTSWTFTDESSVTFQSSVSGAGEFGPNHFPFCSDKGNLIVQKLEKKVANATCQHGLSLLANPNSKNEPMSLLKLASILENQDLSDEDDEEEDISQEEIQQYLKEVSGQREKLRKTLEQRFSQLCIDGLEYENGTYICTKRTCTKHDKGGRGG